MSHPPPCRAVLATPPGRGAIAIIQLHGDTEPVLRALTGIASWPIGRLRLAPLAEVDEGLAGRIADDVAQVMPHGGPRVVQRLLADLIDAGVPVVPSQEIDAIALFPEAPDEVAARMLALLGRARSPLAVDVLLDQPRRVRERPGAAPAPSLRHLIDPPRVVLAGAPNAGKSTLSNALLGRSMSIALDEPGTTRDYTTGLIDLAGLVVQWHDTPGLRETDDETERAAIELSQRLLESADYVIALAEPGGPWPVLGRAADLRVGAKADVASRDDADLCVSARTGEGLAELTARVRDDLVPPNDAAHGLVPAVRPQGRCGPGSPPPLAGEDSGGGSGN